MPSSSSDDGQVRAAECDRDHWPPTAVSNGQLVHHIRIHFSEIGDYEVIVEQMLDDLGSD